MTDPSDPSSDASPHPVPASAEPGVPYAGPPPTLPPVYGQPEPYPPHPGGYGYPYGQPYGYGYPAAWAQPAPPAYPGQRRPGQVVAAAVLAFVQGALVLIASLYVFLLASVARVAVAQAGGPRATVDEFATEATVMALLQVVSVAVLVVGGILALGRRRQTAFILLVGASALQVVFSIYWAIRLTILAGDIPGPDPSGVLAWFSLVFAAMPLVALGLVVIGPGRRWFRQPEAGAH